MAEYAGYVRRKTPINWGTVAGDIVKKMGDVEQDQAAFREKYDTMASDISKELGEYEMGKSQSFNDMAYNATAEGRSMIAEMHNKLKRREISPDEFNRMKMSMSDQWADFSKFSKNYNQAVEGVMKGLDNGSLGAGSEFALRQLEEFSQLKNQRMQWMPGLNGSTSLLATTVDDDGKLVGKPTSMTTLTNPNNMVFNKVQLTDQVKDWTSVVAAYKIGRLSDARKNPEYKKSKETKINEILATDENVLSILSDWGKYTPYKDGDIAPKDGIKMVTNSNGDWVPEITDTLRQEAEKIVNGVMETSVAKIYTPAPSPPRGGDYTPQEKSQFSSGYDATWTAVRDNDFTQLDTTKWEFVTEGNKILVYPKGGDEKTQPVLEVNTTTPEDQKIAARGLSQYYKGFGKDPVTEWNYMDAQRGTEGKKKPDAILEKIKLSPAEEGDLIANIGKADMGSKETETYILDLISSKNPDLDIDFGNPSQPVGSSTGFLPILVNGKEVGRFYTDMYYGGTDYHNANQELIEGIINIGRGSKAATSAAP